MVCLLAFNREQHNAAGLTWSKHAAGAKVCYSDHTPGVRKPYTVLHVTFRLL